MSGPSSATPLVCPSCGSAFGEQERFCPNCKLPLTFEAAYNATDAGAFKAILVNPRSTAF